MTHFDSNTTVVLECHISLLVLCVGLLDVGLLEVGFLEVGLVF